MARDTEDTLLSVLPGSFNYLFSCAISHLMFLLDEEFSLQLLQHPPLSLQLSHSFRF